MTNKPDNTAYPTVSAVISTRNRGDKIVAAIESILANDYPCFDLRVVDQSEDDLTEKAVQPFLADPRFFYTRSLTKGLSAGRNIAIWGSSFEYIAITDDDCVAPKNWLSEMIEAFKIDSRIAIVCGKVVPGEYDRSAGQVTVYEFEEPFLARGMKDKTRIRGITACMGIRKSAWEAVKGFDEMLGVGAPLRSAAETDYIIKTLKAGYYVYQTPRVRMVHNGFRTWQQYRPLIYQYNYGSGAMIAKYFKGRYGFVIPLFANYIGVKILWPIIERLILYHHLTGITSIKAFCSGFLRGLRTPVDWSTGNFQKEN